MHRSVRSRLRLCPATSIVAVTAACAILAALPTGRLLANDCMGPNFGALRLRLSFMDLLPIYLLWLLYAGAVCLVEAGILEFFFQIGYVRCLRYAALANFVSVAIGVLWMAYGNEGGGWKAAILERETGRLAVLLARSFLVTVAEETVVILLLARKSAGVGLALKAVAAANVVSYALSAAIMLRYM